MTTNKGWNAIDERCSQCNNVTKQAKGLNKQNLKKLFFSKPTLQDIIIFLLICMVMFAYVQYNKEVTYYKDVVANKDYLCIIEKPGGGKMGVLLDGTQEMLNDKGEKITINDG